MPEIEKVPPTAGLEVFEGFNRLLKTNSHKKKEHVLRALVRSRKLKKKNAEEKEEENRRLLKKEAKAKKKAQAV